VDVSLRFNRTLRNVKQRVKLFAPAMDTYSRTPDYQSSFSNVIEVKILLIKKTCDEAFRAHFSRLMVKKAI
jgi:hypothetical protein